jgi:hypothetical protein
MAKIMTRGAQYVLKEANETKTSVYTSKITDFASIPESYQPYVAQVYAKGIVTGYPEGSFGGGRQATRAEAATMVVRLIDHIYRLSVDANPQTPVGNQIAFNPQTDVATDGRMKLAKAEEYLMKNLQSLKFYFENGNLCFEGYVVEVPEGFRNSIDIDIICMPGVIPPGGTYGSVPLTAQTPLPKAGSFKEELVGISNLDQIRYIRVAMWIVASNHTNTYQQGYPYEVIWVFETAFDNRINAVEYVAGGSNYGKKNQKFYDLSTVFLWKSE